MSGDVELLRRAAGGDTSAQSLLYTRLDPPMRTTIRRELHRHKHRADAAQVDDLAQEVWAVLLKDRWKQLFAFDPERGALEAYIRVIAAREVGNLLQKQRAQKRAQTLLPLSEECLESPAAPGSTPEDMATAHQLASQLEQHFASVLPERGHLVLRYVFSDGKKPDEVAEILGLKLQVVYNWVFKIRSEATAYFSRL
jgi:RNA polymerase sigma factor (sigma-70 family)